MTYLWLSVLFSGMLVVMFKIFQRLGIDAFTAIVFNYLSATVFAFLYMKNKHYVLGGAVWKDNWWPFALFLGSMFITVFNMTSITTLRYGASTASVAMKLGLVFPVVLAFTVYGEAFSMLKFMGVALALVAVVLSSVKEENAGRHRGIALLPVLVFIGSGACDSFTQLANKYYVIPEHEEAFSLFLFFAAAFWGLVALLYLLVRGVKKLNMKTLLGGVVLGVINYFSFLTMLRALATVPGGSAVVFPMANLGTVAFATLAGVVFFREKLNRLNLIGLVLMAAAMAAMAMA
ncbi:MAG: hypothetical protein NZM35_10980 [Chitinophagales bacterium]|nr:hypothetical protein [Chitinophagales bacterium]MDW8419837.1 hypothetical protein [Chitinophagales bacterium]